ncbi:hypothetical protein V8G54_034827 [Vigna mungo]|uniref:Uncharacterized protein n=1 Tax=Vigna mungo TaxID=3915 RepID=A0AAQ3R9K2_VIGMU
MLNLRSSDGIRCISAGMIAPVKCCTINVYMASAAGISFSPWEDAGERSYVDGLELVGVVKAVLWDLVANNKEEKQRKKEKNVKKGATRGLPRSSDGIRCICAGMITRVKCCTINVYMNSAAGISCNTWEDAGERSDAVLWDLVANNKEEKQRKKETTVKKRCNTRTSQEVTHPSTCLAQARLIADAGMITPVKCCTINVYMASAAGISFNTWEDAGERSEMDGLGPKKP